MLDMRKGVCALCNHEEVIDAPAREYATDDEEPVRLAVAHAPEQLGFITSKRSVDQPIGALRFYVCRACGYTQWFASKPSKIPIDEALGTRLVKKA